MHFSIKKMLEEEVKASSEKDEIHLNWPQNSSLTFKNLSARYRSELPLVLNNLSFHAESG